jgi:hypothetical protein
MQMLDGCDSMEIAYSTRASLVWIENLETGSKEIIAGAGSRLLVA